MKLLVVSLLICATMVLARAFPEPEPEPEPEPFPEEEESTEEESTEMPDPIIGGDADEGNDTSSQKVVKRSANCNYPDNTWHRYSDRIYIFVASRVNWVRAQQICVGASASLVSLRSGGEENFVKRLTRGRPAWIGLSDAQIPSNFLWIDATRYTYKNWCKGHPNNGKTCAVMDVTSSKCWFDIACTPGLPFVCARKVR